MRIRTITCHDVYNYGASLQAYGLMKWLINEGHDAAIIDYKPDYMCDDYNFWILPQYVREKKNVSKSFILRFIYCVYLAPKRFATWRRIKPFKSFREKYLICTRTYKSIKDLNQDPPKADIYIAGSDQIWNVNLTCGNDPAFYLNFGNKTTRKISYAASFALSQIPNEKHKQLKDYLSKLDCIAVREKTGISILNSLGFSGTVVLDPVFLLSRQDWDIVAETSIKQEDYILVYDLYRSETEIKELALSLARKYNYKIVTINGKLPVIFGDYVVQDAGPCEFVSYIKNAKYVITDSFHATAFSVIYNIPFSVFNHKENKSRIVDLLNCVSLIDRFNNISNTVKNINWELCETLLQEQVNKSRQFLKDNIKLATSTNSRLSSK